MFSRPVSRLALLLAALALPLAACTPSASPTPSPSSTETSTTLPEVSGVAVSGAYGTKPTLEFTGDPSPSLERTILSEGTGPVVADETMVVVNYLGQLFGTEDVVDSSFDGYPLSFTQGTGSVISGWEKALEGVHAGSRVLISVPASESFGPDSFTSESLPPDQVLVYVIDVLRVLPSSTTGDPDATPTGKSFPGVTVTGDLGGPATVQVDPDSALPTKDEVIVLAQGSGPALKDGSVTVQYASTNWSGSLSEDTWSTLGVTSVPVGGTDSVLDQLKGVPVGSRVLVIFAPGASDDMPAETATVVVLDLIDQLYVQNPSS